MLQNYQENPNHNNVSPKVNLWIHCRLKKIQKQKERHSAQNDLPHVNNEWSVVVMKHLQNLFPFTQLHKSDKM